VDFDEGGNLEYLVKTLRSNLVLRAFMMIGPVSPVPTKKVKERGCLKLV